MGMSTFLANKILDAIYNAVSFSVTTPYISLHTATPGTTGASEATGGSYSRKDGSAAFPSAASAAIASNADITFTGMPAGTYTHVGVWDASTGGNFLRGGALTASRTLLAGDTFTLTSGNITDAFA